MRRTTSSRVQKTTTGVKYSTVTDGRIHFKGPETLDTALDSLRQKSHTRTHMLRQQG
jgi:hypothetical protein